MRIIFVHGGGDGAYAVDRSLVSALAAALGDRVPIEYPWIPGLEQIDWNKTQAQLTELVRDASADTLLIAHSIGAATMLKLLVNGVNTKIRHAFLLAPPYKAADSHWGVDDFTFPNDFSKRLPANVEIRLYHCEDDEIIPVRDALEYRAKLATARISIVPSGGHQFVDSVGAIADDVRSASLL